ncbi:MAG: alpha/beta hydrolase [Myxococcales bacterium]|nr:alpha/beta hydrolase [Myxococcales bacterium]
MTTTPSDGVFFEPPHRLIDVGHAQLAYRQFGTGPDLVFIHGWPLTQATWRHLVRALKGRFTCHLFDLPGCGQTTWSDNSRIHMPGHAETMCAAIDVLDLQNYGLVAHDSGGGIARSVAAAHGTRVIGLVMGNTEIPGERFPGIGASRLLLGSGLIRAAMRAMLRSRRLSSHRQAMGGCFTDPSYARGSFFDLQTAPLGRGDALAGQLHFVRNFQWEHVDSLANVHPHITAPVLLIWGARDHFFKLKPAQEMLTQFPAGAEIDIIDDGRLFVHEDHAERFAKGAAAHFARCLGASSAASTSESTA